MWASTTQGGAETWWDKIVQAREAKAAGEAMRKDKPTSFHNPKYRPRGADV